MKPEERVRADAPSAMSAYPELIADDTVAFAAAKLVPQVAEQVGDRVTLEVELSGRRVAAGALVPAGDLLTEPTVRVARGSPTDIYAIVMVDPDFPSPGHPSLKDVLLWMVTNVKGPGGLEGADFPVGYMANEAGKGTHRYALLVYQQPGWQKVEPPAARAGFQPKEWAKAKGWGDPVGGTYFRAAHGG